MHNPTSEDSDPNKKKQIYCSYCHGKNNSKDECFKLKRKKNSSNADQSGNLAAASSSSTNSAVSTVKKTPAHLALQPNHIRCKQRCVVCRRSKNIITDN